MTVPKFITWLGQSTQEHKNLHPLTVHFHNNIFIIQLVPTENEHTPRASNIFDVSERTKE
jgi:hypothetical protein